MNQDIISLKAIVDAHPEWAEYADSQVMEALNAAQVEVLKPYSWLSIRTIGSILGVARAAELLDAIKTASASNAVLSYVYTLLNVVQGEEPGIDVGTEEAQTLVDSLAQTLGMTEIEKNKIKAHGKKLVGLAEAAIGRKATNLDVAIVRNTEE